MTDHRLRIRGCRQNNLKNISLDLPKDKTIVITGPSGSGKSSLAFDTIYAEGQRRYLEYLSPQARSWIKQMAKPDVDLIEGLSPTLAIKQLQQSINSRNTVATQTDIYDFLSILYATIGEQHSPVTGKKLTRYSRQEMIEHLLKDYPLGTRIQLAAPVKLVKETLQEAVQRLQAMGFIRLKIDGQDIDPEVPLPDSKTPLLEVIVDRLEMKEGIRERLGSSVETALDIGKGVLKVIEGLEGPHKYFTEIFVCPETSLAFAPLTPADFNFNSAKGACPTCQGQGGMEKAIPSRLFWDEDRPFHEQMIEMLEKFPRKTAAIAIDLWNLFAEKIQLSEEAFPQEILATQMEQILYGSPQELIMKTVIDHQERRLKTSWKGLIPLIDEALKLGKANFDTEDFVQWTVCETCHGGRLKPESLACLIAGKGINKLCAMTVDELIDEIHQWKTNAIAEEILPEIISRLDFLKQVGLGYLQLDRRGPTLSEGEMQRVQLASQIGAKLSGILYVLDEPSRSLHPQDLIHLRHVIDNLRRLGNTVLLVEHEKSMISHADHLVELGPGAGLHGGKITFQGSYEELLKGNSITGAWLSGKDKIPVPKRRRKLEDFLQVDRVNLHNLHDFSVKVPLGVLTAFCGVSGSGKSTLVIDAIAKEMKGWFYREKPPSLLSGFQNLKRLNVIDQQAASLSPRSIPATYIDLMTPLRNLFAKTRLAQARGYTAARFSLNRKGGRCDACEGMGKIRVNMQFMSDIYLTCDVCNGTRYNFETLQVTWENHSIADVLGLSVEKALKLFQNIPDIAHKLQLMRDLGLEYLTLGQNFTTLSGGEIQRLKLVADLAIKNQEPTLYILDEPSAGLHFQDIKKLCKILHHLIEAGHSVFVVEHNLEMLQQADWLIELGPKGGSEGGRLVFEGTPEEIKKAKTPTGRAFKEREK